MVTLADHYRFAGQHIADTLQRFLRITFLDEANQRIDHRHREDHRHVDPMAHHRLEQRCRQQDVDQHIVKMRNKTQPGGFTRLLRQGVFAILLQARSRLCSANPFRRTLHAGESLLDGALIIGRPRFICIHTLSLDF